MAEHFLFGKDALAGEFLVGIDTVQVPEVGDVPERRVGHAQFFPLVDIGRALHKVEAGGQHFRGSLPVRAVVAKPGDRPGLVVVFPEQAVPGHRIQSFLPFGEDGFQIPQIEAAVRPFVGAVGVHVHVLELEDHIQLPPVAAGIFSGFLQGDPGTFPHRQGVVAVQDFSAHFLKIFVDPGTVGSFVEAGVSVDPWSSVGEGGILGDQAYHVHAESIHALVQPPVHHGEDIPADGWIFPVLVRLLPGEEVEIIHIRGPVIFPGRAGEAGTPVVGGFLVSGRPPDIVVPVRVVPGTAAFQEPGVLVGSVVHHQIHDQAQAPPVHFVKEAVKVLHGPELLHDRLIVADVVPIVIVGRLIDRREPDHIHAQFLQIIQFFRDPVQIPDPVSIAVSEAAGVDLIDHTFLPPYPFHDRSFLPY